MSYPQQPVNRDGSILVPLRSIFESLGADVAYDPATQTIQGTRGDTTVTLRIGSTTAQRDGETLTLAQPPALIGSSVFVPIRFIGESLGADVGWDPASSTIRIQSKVTAALLDVKETLPLTNDKGEPLTLLHGGDVKLRWWLQDESPYENFSGFIGADGHVIALGFDEQMTLDRRTGERIATTPRRRNEVYLAGRATRGAFGYDVSVNADDRAWVWEGVPSLSESNAESLFIVEGEPSDDYMMVTAALDRERRLIVPTADGLAAYDLQGELAWLHKEWSTPSGTISATDRIMEIATDSANRVYVSYLSGFVALDEDGKTLAALPEWFVPEVLEDGTLVEGGASYRIEDGRLVSLGGLDLGDETRYVSEEGEATLRRVDPATGATLWSYGLSAAERGLGYDLFNSTLVSDGADNVYISTNGGTVHSLDARGNLRLILTVNNRTISSAAVLPLSATEFIVIEGNKIMCFEIDR